MRGSKAKNLSSLFRSTIKKASKNSDSNSTAANLKTLGSLQTNSTSILRDKLKSTSRSKKSVTASESVSFSSSLQEFQKHSAEESETDLFKAISGILGAKSAEVLGSCVLPASDVPNDGKSKEENLDIPWFSSTSTTTANTHVNTSASDRVKVVSRGRKEKWVFKNSQSRRFQRLVTMCGEKMGADATLAVFGKLRRETGLKEYKTLIRFCVEKAKESQNEEDSLDHIHRAYQLFRSMREQGFQVEDEVFGPLLLYLIDMRMVEEFHFFSEVIKDGNSAMLPRLGYYEMLLWITVNNEDKIQELCNSTVFDADGDGFHLAENYLLALCETDRQKEILQLLEVVDISKVSSLNYVSSMFESLGRQSLDELAEKLILAIKTSEIEAENISYFICNYAINIPNLAVEDVISKFESLHEKLDVRPSSISYEKLIMFCCESLKVHAALAIVDKMCQLDLALSVEIFYPILHAVEDSCELDLVHPIYSVIRRHNLKPKSKAMEILINFSVKIKDFEGAYNMLRDLKEMNTRPTPSMYNAILAGYFREKNFHSGEEVLNQMELADVKPDSRTFSYLICNSEREEDIIKYFEEMQSAKVEATKHVYMALINAYANRGQFEKAKQVVLDKGIPSKNINEIKSGLVSALASGGQLSDALKCYDEMKEDGCHLEPKAAISLIEHLQYEVELNRMLQFLEELKDPNFWFDGCERVVMFCIRHKHLSSAIKLLKQLKDQDKMSTCAVLDQVFCQIFEMNPIDLQIGLDLLQAVKEELQLCPSRTSLDFLLSACVSAKDPLCGRLVWEEYQKAGLSYNVLTYIRMYQLHLACGENKNAKKVLKKISKDDPHVRSIIRACESTFSKSKSMKKKQK